MLLSECLKKKLIASAERKIDIRLQHHLTGQASESLCHVKTASPQGEPPCLRLCQAEQKTVQRECGCDVPHHFVSEMSMQCVERQFLVQAVN